MNRNWTAVLVVASLLGAAAGPGTEAFRVAAARADGEEKPPADGEKKAEGPDVDEVKDYCKNFESTLNKMTNEDAIKGVKQLRDYWTAPGLDESLQKPLIGAMGKVLRLRNKDAVVEEATKALADFGEKGADMIKMIVDGSCKQKTIPMGIVEAGLKSLGKIASIRPADTKFLTDLLKFKDESVIASAANAIAGYKKAPGAVRQDLFEELLKMSEGPYNASEGNDANAKRRWNIFGADVVAAMKALSAQNYTNPKEFRAWFNEKGPGGGRHKDSWPDPEEAK